MIQMHKNEGFVLAVVLLVTAVITLIMGSFVLVTMTHFKMNQRAADSIRAYYAADAGITDAFIQLRTSDHTFSLANSSYAIGTDHGSYNVQVTSDGLSLATYTITSAGTYGGVTRTLELKVQTTTCAKHGYLSGTEVDPVWGGNYFITGMISTGPTSTNGQFNMWGAPVFTGLVSQVAPTVHYWNGEPGSWSGADNPDYQKGLVTGITPVIMPNASTMLNAVKTAAQVTGASGGLYLTTDGTITLTFVSDGTVNVTNTTTDTSNESYGWLNHNVPIPANGSLFVEGGNTRVLGVLKGRLTVASDNNIFIGGNLIYNTDPRTHPESTDVLGMVAQNKVYVEDLGASRPHDIEIDGYIVALGQFEVQNFWTFAAGNMVQFGGLTSTLPGGLTGLFDPGTGQVIFGYNQLQYYDNRFLTGSPPWFPVLMDQNNLVIYNKISFSEL